MIRTRIAIIAFCALTGLGCEAQIVGVQIPGCYVDETGVAECAGMTSAEASASYGVLAQVNLYPDTSEYYRYAKVLRGQSGNNISVQCWTDLEPLSSLFIDGVHQNGYELGAWETGGYKDPYDVEQVDIATVLGGDTIYCAAAQEPPRNFWVDLFDISQTYNGVTPIWECEVPDKKSSNVREVPAIMNCEMYGTAATAHEVMLLPNDIAGVDGPGGAVFNWTTMEWQLVNRNSNPACAVVETETGRTPVVLSMAGLRPEERPTVHRQEDPRLTEGELVTFKVWSGIECPIERKLEEFDIGQPETMVSFRAARGAVTFETELSWQSLSLSTPLVANNNLTVELEYRLVDGEVSTRNVHVTCRNATGADSQIQVWEMREVSEGTFEYATPLFRVRKCDAFEETTEEIDSELFGSTLFGAVTDSVLAQVVIQDELENVGLFEVGGLPLEAVEYDGEVSGPVPDGFTEWYEIF